MLREVHAAGERQSWGLNAHFSDLCPGSPLLRGSWFLQLDGQGGETGSDVMEGAWTPHI